MADDLRRRIEVETLVGILDEVDYYRLLKLRPGVPIPEVEKAYASQSQAFHPDRFFGSRDAQLTRDVTTLFKKINEGYQVLRDPDLKQLYDQKLGVKQVGSDAEVTVDPEVGRISKADLERELAAREGSEVVSDKRAKKYWDLAQIAAVNRDWNGVVMNVQFAMNYEPDNPLLKEKLRDAKVRMREKAQKNKNPYKIKIV